MCNYQTLFHDDTTGYVIRCLECDKIQVGYGNLMLTVSSEGFGALQWWLNKTRSELQPGLKSTVRCIPIPTPCEGIRLLLSVRELDELQAMLDDADTEMRSTQLINLFNKDEAPGNHD